MKFSSKKRKGFQIVFLGLSLVSTSCAEDRTKSGFANLSDFLTWADRALARDDYKVLADSQLQKDSKKIQVRYIKKLDSDLGKGTLTKIFKGRKFPGDQQAYKLGGHFKELGCGHIDFVKKDGRWYLSRIWQCR